jgi:hypothetical protein
VGTVAGLLQHGSELVLAVESATAVPGQHERRAIPWHAVERIDHEALAVWLHLSEEEFGRADELDADAAREGDEAEARRVTELPQTMAPQAEVSPGGPVDRTVVPLMPALAGAVAFGVLVVVAAATAFQTPWVYLGFAVPVALAAVALAIGYRAWRTPYEQRGAQKP